MRLDKAELERARRLLCELQDRIREDIRAVGRMNRVAATTAADTIYAVDRVSEHTVTDWLRRHWPRAWPLELVMEGLRGATTIPARTPVEATAFKLIVDPIDGTRMLMYDKRSAWSLAGLAVQRGPATALADIFLAVMTELPTRKAGYADQLSAIRGRGVHATRVDLRTGRAKRFIPQHSRARGLEHGFASFAKFFPEAKGWLARVEEELWRRLARPTAALGRPVFDDQYLSTGGQIYELAVGHDRFVADLRPLALARLKLDSALTCHPYDLCTALVAQEAGCLIESPDGAPVNAPLDTTTPIAWVGYSNGNLRRLVAPALRRTLREAAGPRAFSGPVPPPRRGRC